MDDPIFLGFDRTRISNQQSALVVYSGMCMNSTQSFDTSDGEPKATPTNVQEDSTTHSSATFMVCVVACGSFSTATTTATKIMPFECFFLKIIARQERAWLICRPNECINQSNLDIKHHRPAPSNSFQFQRYTCTHAFQTISRATSTNYNNEDTTAIAITLAGGGYVGSILYYCGRPGTTTLKKHFAEATIHSSYGMNCLEIPSNTNHFHGVADQD